MSRKFIDLDRLKINLENLSDEIVPPPIPGKIGNQKLDEAYHFAAAVLTYYDPWVLRPFEPPQQATQDDHQAAIDRLLKNSAFRYDDLGQPVWFMMPEARREALGRLKSRKRIQKALTHTSDRPNDHLQTLCEAYISNRAQPLASQSLGELRLSLQIINWLAETDLARELPTPQAIQDQIVYQELMHPLHYLVEDGFYGREKTLADFENYINSPSSGIPLLIHGPGGVGKSTLLAELILRQTEKKPPGGRLPFSYIDFDAVQIDLLEPLTIMLESARQLAIQYPEFAVPADEFVTDWAYNLEVDSLRGGQSIFTEQFEAVEGFGTLNVRGDSNYRYTENYILEFKTLVEPLFRDKRPWLLVIDTFEEVQLRSRDAVVAIRNFLEQLQAEIPQVRVFIGGRGEVGQMPVQPYFLAGFDEAAAQNLLNLYGVSGEQITSLIYQTIGGNPLSLKLAARVIKQENLLDTEADPLAVKALLNKIKEGNIQGQLYRRVLEHINNVEVQKLAHPGLTLRVITPDLIDKVLAKPCQVTVDGPADAQRLFDLLEREVSLVLPAGPNIVRHRPDVRSVMISALHNDQPLITHAIHEAAIVYYEELDGPEARAEEIYHRLFIEQDLDHIKQRWERRWHDKLDDALRPALYELPTRVRTWLAAQLQLTGVEGVDWNDADIEEWEQITEKRVRDLVRSNDWQGALTLLAERPERTIGSRLYYLETTILRQQKRYEEARRIAYDGLYSLKIAKKEIQLLDLIRQTISIDMKLGHIAAARQKWEEARKLLFAQNHLNALVALELEVFDLKLIRIEKNAGKEVSSELRERILQQFLDLSETELLSHPDLIRDILKEFGNENTNVLRRGLNLLLLDELSAKQQSDMAHVMQLWDLALSKTLGEAPGVLYRSLKRANDLGYEEGWLLYMQTTKTRRIKRDLDHMLDRYGHIESKIEVKSISGNVAAVGSKGVNISGDIIIGNILTGDQNSISIEDNTKSSKD